MIYGLSNQRQLTRAGKIRIGERTQSKKGFEIPKKLDYLKFDPVDPSLHEDWHSLYGDKPTSIPVMLPSDNPEEVFPHEYRRWTSSNKLFCSGDNQIARRPNLQTNTVDEVACNESCPFRALDSIPADKEEKKRRACKPEGTLRVVLYELPTMGVFELKAATMSIVRINTALDQIQRTFGRLAGVPLVLSMVPIKLTTGIVYVFQFVVRMSIQEALRQRSEQPALLSTPTEEDLADESLDEEEATGNELPAAPNLENGEATEALLSEVIGREKQGTFQSTQHRDRARTKHAGTTHLYDCSAQQLTAYLTYLAGKISEGNTQGESPEDPENDLGKELNELIGRFPVEDQEGYFDTVRRIQGDEQSKRGFKCNLEGKLKSMEATVSN
jgi:hypothetical protein